MKYHNLYVSCANGKWVVITDTKPGLIGHYYKFHPMKARIVKPAYDEADFHYFRKAKEPIPVGTELEVDCWWMNFYGSYFVIPYNGCDYDVKTDCVELI